jgi:hypothetical protein
VYFLVTGKNIAGKTFLVLKFLIKQHDMKEMGTIAPAFFTPTLDGAEWSVSRPGRFTPGERNRRQSLVRRLRGPRDSLQAVEK